MGSEARQPNLREAECCRNCRHFEWMPIGQSQCKRMTPWVGVQGAYICDDYEDTKGRKETNDE